MLLLALTSNVLLLPRNVVAQWRLLYPSSHELYTVYFLDAQGTPNIGFAGGTLRTSDGGATWKIMNGSSLTYDYAFKDSLVGWSATEMGLMQTTDAGLTWQYVMPTYNYPQYAVHYDPTSHGLFSTGWGDGNTFISFDDGRTFTRNYSDLLNGFAFSSDSLGLIASDGFGNGWQRTTNAGHTWQRLGIDTECWQPVALPNTDTFLAITDLFANVIRSTDRGDSWKVIYAFPIITAPDEVGASSGCMRWDHGRLFTQLRSGCYLSIDTGVTWKWLCGPPPSINRIYDMRFCVVGNRVFSTTFESGDDRACNLWMLNLDSMQYFETGLAFADGSKTLLTAAGNLVTVNFISPENPSVGIDSAHLVIRFDPSLDLSALKLPASWKILDSSTNGNTIRLSFTADSSQELPNPILQLTFKTYLAASSAKVYLDSAHLYGKRLNCDCAALSVAGPDSVEIDFTGCGDSTLLRFMSGQSPFEIVSVQPNPAQNEILVRVVGGGEITDDLTDPGATGENPTLHAELYDALGRAAIPGQNVRGTSLQLDVSQVPSGLYYLRVTSNGFAQTRSVSIER